MKLKLTHRLYEGYTGQIGPYHFENGISVEDIPYAERARIGASIKCVEINDDGSTGEDPSPSSKSVMNRHMRIGLASLPRQTEAEKSEENVQAVMGSEKPKQLLTHEALEQIATESGIAGLREVANAWGVKSKSIPVLMQMILDEQKSYVERQTRTLTEKGVPLEEIAKLLSPVSELVQVKETFTKKAKSAPAVVTTEQVEETKQIDIAAAAASGDLAAGLNAHVSIVEADRPE